MEAPSEHRSARMRHHHEDDTLLFPKRPPDNLSLDVDTGRHARVFPDNVMTGGDIMANKASQNRARFFVIGGFCCFLFLLVTVSIYSSLNEQENVEIRAADELETEAEFIPEDEIIEEAFSEDEENPDGEPVDESKNEENSVVAETDDVSEISQDGPNKDVFIMDVNGIRFEIGIGSDGDFDLPDGLILNPHVRQHWTLIQNTLGLDYYDDEETGDVIIGKDGDGKLEPPLPSEEDTLADVDVPPPAEANAVRMPEGLMFDAPPLTEEHVHGEGCDPVFVDVKDTMEELAAGDKVLEGEEVAEDPK